MNIRNAIVMPKTLSILKQLGEQIKYARLRRGLTITIVSERASISRATVYKVERGDPSVAIGIYANVLHSLNGMDRDLLLVAKDEIYIEKLKELEIVNPRIRRKD